MALQNCGGPLSRALVFKEFRGVAVHHLVDWALPPASVDGTFEPGGRQGAQLAVRRLDTRILFVAAVWEVGFDQIVSVDAEIPALSRYVALN